MVHISLSVSKKINKMHERVTMKYNIKQDGLSKQASFRSSSKWFGHASLTKSISSKLVQKVQKPLK